LKLASARRMHHYPLIAGHGRQMEQERVTQSNRQVLYISYDDFEP